MHCLIVSPIASHPQFQGNSARIFRFGRCLQAMGYQVHFLYYPMEGLTEAQTRAMSETWDYFYSIPCKQTTDRMSFPGHFGIDDWCDPRIGELAARLHKRWNYRFVMVNYVWMSGVLTALPKNVAKVLDTHDVFGDRHIRAIKAGMQPEWFYTSVEEEKRGLMRADFVAAIQDEEAEYFRSLGVPNVKTIGFISPARQVPRQPREKPVVGYIGSSNPWNVNAYKELLKALMKRPDVMDRADFVLAGPVCNKVGKKTGPFKLLGIVPKLEDFYAAIDIAINPMLGGTGLKIKTIEALAFGRGILSTTDGFIGIETEAEHHKLTKLDDMVDRLGTLLENNISAETMKQESRNIFFRYQQQQAIHFQQTFSIVAKGATSVAVETVYTETI